MNWILRLALLGLVTGHDNHDAWENWTAHEHWPPGELNCWHGFRTFDPLTQQRVYRIGVHAPAGVETALREYNLTFTTYLNAVVGKRFKPNIEFTMHATSDPLQDWVDGGDTSVDFMYSDTGIYSCIATEIGAQPIGTTVAHQSARGRDYALDQFAGTMLVLSSNEEIEDVEDLRGKIIAAQSFSDFAGAQAQFFVMGEEGLDFVVDPKQVIFTGNNDDIVKGVLNGTWDVGFVRTGQVERTVDTKTGDLVNPDLFKVISPRIHILDEGEIFPFLHSTPVFPEWPLYVKPGISRIVSEEVAGAMINFEYHYFVGDAIKRCKEAANSTAEMDICNTMPPVYFDPLARCDTTRELADLALQAGKAGFHTGFRPPRSYFGVRTMQQDAGFIVEEETGDGKWHCERAASLYDGIRCPDGFYKVPENAFKKQCDVLGLPCPQEYSCFCSPCIEAFEVNVFPWHNDTTEEFLFSLENGCDKMSLCSSVEQRTPAIFRAYDNRQRYNATLSALLHIGQQSTWLHVTVLEDFLYEFSFTQLQRGVAIVEVYVDEVQIPESPFRVEIIDRDCDIDFHAQNMAPDENGICQCSSGTIEIGRDCIESGTFAAIASSVAVVILAQFFFCYVRWRRKKNDEVWQVNHEELHFNHPVEIIGQGAFGVVLLAEYRGTKVAIKRVLPMQKVKSRSGSMSMGKGQETNQDTSEEDVENQADSKSSPAVEDSSLGARRGSLTSGSRTSSNELDFLGGLSIGNKKTLLRRLFPYLFPDETSRYNLNVLGTASGGSTTTKSVLRMCLPHCDEATRRQNEFMAEMRLLSRLRHPCITTVMGAVVTGNEPMMVMEFMENGSLYDLLRNETLYTGGEIIIQIVRDVAQGLRFLHASKPPILHGDLKAKNILIDSRFRAKVADFGLATKNNGQLTGTPFWMAPEYLRRKSEYTTSCDIYAFGMMMYEIYSRKIPYEGEHPRKILRKVCDPRINYRPGIPGTCPKKMSEVMQKCWSSDPFFRPEAKDLDMVFADMSANDGEPLIDEANTRLRKIVATGDMLYKVFPKKVADQLKVGQKVEPETHDNVTIFFSDIVRFTDISRALTPFKVCNLLDRLYMEFDRLSSEHHVFKVETIGDAWMGVTNLEGDQNDTHVARIARFAVDAVRAASKIVIDEDDPRAGCVHIRVGFHSGQVVSNVIGSLNPRYGLFGDTVNTASRMESLSVSDMIQCSDISAKLLRDQAPNLPIRRRGKVAVKGKGNMTTYWIGETAPKTKVKKAPKKVFDDEKVVAFKDSPLSAQPTTPRKLMQVQSSGDLEGPDLLNMSDSKGFLKSDGSACKYKRSLSQ
ncbi:unnamed protein product [Cylindrotheca closterium]|uniref:guanylate cyclase n=1 Tax=Cylindrotheca closterium TaxID=2856 RepID=A0AAD2G688_9STRA|nr:unnamed protein product [Cylindrotheca closterium]